MANWLDNSEQQKKEQERLAKERSEEANRQYLREKEAQNKKKEQELIFSANLDKVGFFKLCERIKKTGKEIEYGVNRLTLKGGETHHNGYVSSFDYGDTDVDEDMWGVYRKESTIFERKLLFEQTTESITNSRYALRILSFKRAS